MRPARFQSFAVDTLRQAAHPLVKEVATLSEAGDSKHPFGVAVQLASGGELRWQVIGESAPGDKYDQPEVPVEGESPMALIDGGDLPAKADKAAGEAWLAGLLSSAGSRELATIEQWSRRDDAKPGHHGLTVRCHSGAKVYVRAL